MGRRVGNGASLPAHSEQFWGSGFFAGTEMRRNRPPGNVENVVREVFFNSWFVEWESEASLHAHDGQSWGTGVLAGTEARENPMPGYDEKDFSRTSRLEMKGCRI